MLVRILKPVDYTPARDDSPRCYGQLRYRRNETLIEFAKTDGAKASGKPVLHFPVGATPDLKPEVAERFVADGVAEILDQPAPQFVSRAEIMEGVVVQ